MMGDKILHCVGDFISTDATKYEEFLECIKTLFPFPW